MLARIRMKQDTTIAEIAGESHIQFCHGRLGKTECTAGFVIFKMWRYWAPMKTFKHLLFAVITSLLLTAGLATAAESFDMVTTSSQVQQVNDAPPMPLLRHPALISADDSDPTHPFRRRRQPPAGAWAS